MVSGVFYLYSQAMSVLVFFLATLLAIVCHAACALIFSERERLLLSAAFLFFRSSFISNAVVDIHFFGVHFVWHEDASAFSITSLFFSTVSSSASLSKVLEPVAQCDSESLVYTSPSSKTANLRLTGG